MVTSQCGICGVEIVRAGFVPAKFCSRDCAAQHRRTWKPVSREWLEQKYLHEGLGTVQIGRIVDRHPKRVYEWLRDFGIPIREKWHGNVPPPKPIHDECWLRERYQSGGNCYSIAEECGVTPNTVWNYLVKFGIQTRTATESVILSGKPRGAKGERNGMFGRRGPASSNWKGGATPERQAFYQTAEWATACSEVWRRDDASCQRCGVRKTSEDQEFCVHHIVTFAVKELRAEVTNLVLLCKPCHLWVHSNANEQRRFIREP
jgi:hypothetical protein